MKSRKKKKHYNRQRQREKEINRAYKDRLFIFIFGSEQNREWTLSLYNAVNNSSYTDASKIEFTTIKNILYLGMHNDVSFIVDNQMSLYEQQSSYNPNMPLRLLQYVGHLFDQYVEKQAANIYSQRLIPLPAPKLVVFYNGSKALADETWLKLSDSFPQNVDFDIEVTVRMLNIHYDHNQKLLMECKPLLEYSWLIDAIHANTTKMSVTTAVNTALHDMPGDFIIRPFLMSHKAEVLGMLRTEYNEAETLDRLKKDYLEQGKEIGLEQGMEIGLEQGMEQGKEIGLEQGKEIGLEQGKEIGEILTMIRLVNSHILSPTTAAEQLNISEDKFQCYIDNPELVVQM